MPIDWGKPIQPREIPVQPAPMQQPVQQPSQYAQQPVGTYVPQVPNVATAANMGVTAAKRAIWPWVVAFMSLFFMLLIVIGLVVALLFWPDSGGDGETPSRPDDAAVVELTNPGEYYVVNVANGFAAVCDTIIEKADSSEFKDLGDIEAIYSSSTKKVREKALLPFKEQVFDELNGDKFSNEKAARLFRLMKEGYLEAIK